MDMHTIVTDQLLVNQATLGEQKSRVEG